jgi:hypothetical protein
MEGGWNTLGVALVLILLAMMPIRTAKRHGSLAYADFCGTF